MKALMCTQWGTPDKLVVQEVPDPVPGPGELAIRVHAAGVNFPDGLIIQNKYQYQPALPFIPGVECAGVVDSIGPGVGVFRPGDRVIAFPPLGAFAERLACKAANVVPMPESVDFITAAAFVTTYATAYHALKDRAALQAGETLLVLGASGGVGLAAVQIGRQLGARVIAAASTDEKLGVCRQYGADALINYKRDDLKEAINRETSGKGVDVVYDPVGGPHSEVALRACAWRGRFLVIGFAGGEVPRFPANLPLLKGCSIVGVFWGRYASTEPARNAADLAVLLEWQQKGRLHPHVSGVYPLERGAAAIAALLERRQSGKAVIVPGVE